MKKISLSVPSLKGNEKKYVLNAIDKEWVSTGGQYINDFEINIAKYLKIQGAVACQSGTAGIHLALNICNIEKNNEVIVPTLTFIATVNPVKYLSANPIFMDCDDTLTIDCDKIEEFCIKQCTFNNGILINKKTGNQVKAIIVVHIFGNMANMEKIMSIAKRFNLKVIEDATEALGTYYTNGIYKEKFAGTIGDIGVYSFNGNKIITSGGGGMLVSNKEEILTKAKYLSTQAKDDALYYVHNEIGYNYRMTNIQAALGVAQLEQLNNFIKIKKENYEKYKEYLNGLTAFQLLDFREEIESNYWFYSLLIKDEEINRSKLIKYLAEKGIETRPLWSLINKQFPYQDAINYKIEKANYYEKNIINIPCSSNLLENEIKFVVNCLREFLSF